MDGEPSQAGNVWNKEDVITIISWVAIGRKKIREMELIVDHNRYFMRQVTFYNLIFSSASGTVGVATIENASLADSTRFWCNVAVVMASFLITLCTGALKICQVQENLELAIKYKQDWISFAAEIASEIQLPDKYRRESQFVINKNRAKYLELLKLDIEVPKIVTRKMKEMVDYEHKCLKLQGNRGERDSSSLVDILANIIDYEHMKLKNSLVDEDDDSSDDLSSDNLITDINNETELRKKALRFDARNQSMVPSSSFRNGGMGLSRQRRPPIEDNRYVIPSATPTDKTTKTTAFDRLTRCGRLTPTQKDISTDSDDDLENQRRKEYK